MLTSKPFSAIIVARNPDNRWIQMADKIPRDLFEGKYADLFPSDTCNVVKLLRMAHGSLIIQDRSQFPDKELVGQITEDLYHQYFIRLPGYQDTPPFDASTLVLFRKWIIADMLSEVNEYLLAHKDDDQPGQALLWHGMYRNQAERNTADIHRVICIRVESFYDSETDTFASIQY